MRKKIYRAALSLVAVVTAFAIAELYLAVSEPLKKKRKRYMLTREIFQYSSDNVCYDGDVGYVPKKDLIMIMRGEGFRTRIVTNSLGFRDDEISARAPDIFLMGDSFGFGWGVEKSRTCERELESLSGKRVLNLSVPGYGTLQEYLLFRKLAPRYELTGKTAIFLFYINDIIDNTGFGFGAYPRVVGRAGGYAVEEPTRDGYEKWQQVCKSEMYSGIFKKSYFAYKIRKAFLQIKKRVADEESDATFGTVDRFDAFRFVIEEIKAFTDSRQVRVIFVLIPSIKDYEENDPTYAGIRNKDIFMRVRDILSRESIMFLDLKDALSRDDYYLYDGHWKPSGHYKAALAIGKSLEI